MASNEYEGKWTLSFSGLFPLEKLATPFFAPFSDNNANFCFDATYQNLHASYVPVYKLKLVRLSNGSIPLMLKVSVCLCRSDESILWQYPSIVLNDDVNYFNFNEIPLNETSRPISINHRGMRGRTFIIKCKMTISHQDQTSQSADKKIKCVDVRRNPKPCKCVDVIRNLKSLYEQSLLSDFVFKVGEKSFHAHRNILAAHSLIFMKMMTHDFMESKTNSVTITDATPEIFDLFLRCLYAGELENMSWDSLKELYYLVDKYDVGFLKVECTVAAISILSVDLVCEILKLAYKFSDSDLKIDAINFAVKHIKEIVPREDWKELVKTHPMIGYDVTVNFVPK